MSTIMMTIMMRELLKTLTIPSMVLTKRAVAATTISKNLAEAVKSPKRGLGRSLVIVVAIPKSRHLRGPITTESNPLNMATMGRDISLGTIVMTIDNSVTARLMKIVKIIRTMVTRIKIGTSFVITLITIIDNTTITTTRILNMYNSRGNQNYEGFNPDSSYCNEQELDQSSSQSSIYTQYLERQVHMLKQASTLQGPAQTLMSCSSDSNQQGYIQTTPSSVRTSQVAPQGPSSPNEQGNQQSQTSSREVLQLTPRLSSLVTLPVSEQSASTSTNQGSTEPRFSANQSIRQNSDCITTYDRALNHDRVVSKLDSTRSEALQVISNLKSEFHTYHHRERTLIDSLQKLHKDNKAQRDS